MTQKEPWQEVRVPVVSVMRNIVCGGQRPRIPTPCPSLKFTKLIERCWAGDPADRPTFAEIVSEITSWDELDIVQGLP